MSGRVLIVQFGSVGDVLLTGPAMRAVAAQADHVSLLCGPRGAPAAMLLPGIDSILVWSAPWIDGETPTKPKFDRLVEDLWDRNFEAAVILGDCPLPTALVLKLARIPHVAACSADPAGALVDLRHASAADEPECSMALVRALGYELPQGDDGALRIERPHGPTAAFAGDYVVVHGGAGELVDRLVAADRRVVVTAGEDALGPARADVIDLRGRLALPELADVLADADAVVTGDHDTAQLAAAVGTPVVAPADAPGALDHVAPVNAGA